MAAQNDLLSAVKWLVAEAMDVAARRGHLEAVNGYTLIVQKDALLLRWLELLLV
ncbi:hypothetical protein GN958_ATG00089, partial [Phytophthora infestans]